MSEQRVTIVGLGYVGLPVMLAFHRAGFHVTGLDTNPKRIAELLSSFDRTGQVQKEEMSPILDQLTSNPLDILTSDVFVITVQTTLNSNNSPDLSKVHDATHFVGEKLRRGNLVVISSTVTIGFVNEVAIPILESVSRLKAGSDFSVAYAPERIDPGNSHNNYSNTVKIVSGFDSLALERVAGLYSKVAQGGIIKAPTIRVAEASRILENAQRDTNIALLNEAAAVFAVHGIDTGEVLDVARTKWNFLNFHPGLVGGHCVNTHTHFLSEAASRVGIDPVLTSVVRQSNDLVPERIVKACIQRLMVRSTELPAIVSIFGLTYKENVPDMRGSLVAHIVKGLMSYGCHVQVSDCIARSDDVLEALGIEPKNEEQLKKADAVIIAVPHNEYKNRGWKLVNDNLRSGPKVVLDVRGILDRSQYDTGISLWRL